MDIEIKSQPFTKHSLRELKQGLSSQTIRRFGAIVDHQKLKFSYNALVAWQKQYLSKALSEKLKKKEAISHIYLRKAHPLWPFGLYTMIHSQNKDDLDLFISQVKQLLGNCEYKVLTTIKEFKKTSFNPHI